MTPRPLRRPRFPAARAREALKLAREFGENIRVIVKPDGEVEIAAGPAQPPADPAGARPKRRLVF